MNGVLGYFIYSELFMVVVEWILYLKICWCWGIMVVVFLFYLFIFFLHGSYWLSYNCWNSLLKNK